MVILTDTGWIGWRGQSYPTPEEAVQSLHQRRNLYAEPLAPPGQPPSEAIKNSPLLTFTEPWRNLVAHFLAHPNQMHQLLTPRKFEELIAELFHAEGHEVQLTPASKDGGRDILVSVNAPHARHLYLVECKRYAPQNPVDVALVRGLYGVVEKERATLGMLVTTSSFTTGAIEFAHEVQHRMSLKDYRTLIDMLRQYHPLQAQPAVPADANALRHLRG